jgi:hypothetical protein
MSDPRPSLVPCGAGPAVGRHFAGYSSETERPAIFRCESFDPRLGYWLVNIADAADRALAYPSELGTAYLPARDRGAYWYVWRSGERLPKAAVGGA